MRLLIVTLIFLGALLIVQGVNDRRVERAREESRVEYRYIPRSALDEQYYGTPASERFAPMFAEAHPPDIRVRTPEDAGTVQGAWDPPSRVQSDENKMEPVQSQRELAAGQIQSLGNPFAAEHAPVEEFSTAVADARQAPTPRRSARRRARRRENLDGFQADNAFTHGSNGL